MRKSEREIADLSDKFQTLLRCEYLTLALQDDAAPYVLPVNFGAELEGDRLSLYFHCAVAGKKLELLEELYALQNNQPMSGEQRELSARLIEELWEDRA